MALESLNIKEWLAKQNNCGIGNIEEIYSSEIGIDFLLVWSLYENKCFNFYVNPGKFDDFSNINENIYGELEEEINHFYERYRTKENNFKNLGLKHKVENEIIKILDDFDDETEANKIFFLLHVIYRFRNNMFHGEKLVYTWFSEYKTQIEHCITAMQKLIENKTRN